MAIVLKEVDERHQRSPQETEELLAKRIGRILRKEVHPTLSPASLAVELHRVPSLVPHGCSSRSSHGESSQKPRRCSIPTTNFKSSHLKDVHLICYLPTTPPCVICILCLSISFHLKLEFLNRNQTPNVIFLSRELSRRCCEKKKIRFEWVFYSNVMKKFFQNIIAILTSLQSNRSKMLLCPILSLFHF